MRLSIFSFKSYWLCVFFFLLIFTPVELSIRAWYPFERSENELFELGARIREAKNVDIGLFGNSIIRVLGSDEIEQQLAGKYPEIDVENYSVSGLSGLHVLKAMQKFNSIPKTCVLLISFRDADFNESALNNSMLAIRAGAKQYTWEAFKYYVDYSLEKLLTQTISSTGRFPPNAFLGQSMRELIQLKPVTAYKSLFGYHVSHRNPVQTESKQDLVEYGIFVYKNRTSRLQIYGDGYIQKYIDTCEEIRKKTRLIIVRLPMHPEVVAIEDSLFRENFKTLIKYCQNHNIPYYDFTLPEYPQFETIDGIHMTYESKENFIPIFLHKIMTNF